MFPFPSLEGKPPTLQAVSTARDAAQESPVYLRAAALTYLTAPYPSDNMEGLFEALLLLAADKAGSGAVGRADAGNWFKRAWKRVTDSSAAYLLKARQEDFIDAFSRQLELYPAEETRVVMLSCHCLIVSNRRLCFGTLYATNCGLYFCAATAHAARNASGERAETASTSSADSCAAEPAAGGMELIKERVLFTDIASFLPSIFLEQKNNAPPFIQGVPSGMVAPTALQVFTVRQSTVIQFIHLHDVVVKPPGRPTGAGGAQDAPCTDVVRKQEHALIHELPSNLDTFKFCALLLRLWGGRLQGLGLPLGHPAAAYAAPH
ncbi:hypothetical protein ABL78_4232 [Leptomonas seymouri]|uniref:GRAM domain-containing protein n=1 Tax=Leptomonas seymouri TaxID=5684 RepID=A0A0N0P5P7_LEPSE|nr:hypothetical protein ABL78_4232 [Leptomonas seymouri]|eukprot:KPI86716.1 hypothetical protein ABL78_4232 [Leptomonas seymouri]